MSQHHATSPNFQTCQLQIDPNLDVVRLKLNNKAFFVLKLLGVSYIFFDF